MLCKIKELFKKLLPPLFEDLLFLRSLSHNTSLGRFVKINRPCRIGNSAVGDYSYIGPYSLVSHTTIGKFCSIGPGFFSGWGVHPIDKLSTAPMFYSTAMQNGMTLAKENKCVERRPIVIGNDVFIGVNVTVLDGVTIGDGAVVAAGAVVASDVEPYSVVGGVPAKEIRKRFPQEWIAKLLKIQWWNFPKEKLKLIEHYYDDVESFLRVADEVSHE